MFQLFMHRFDMKLKILFLNKAFLSQLTRIWDFVVYLENHHLLLETRNCFKTECLFDLKPGCKFKFVRCLQTYQKN